MQCCHAARWHQLLSCPTPLVGGGAQEISGEGWHLPYPWQSGAIRDRKKLLVGLALHIPMLRAEQANAEGEEVKNDGEKKKKKDAVAD